MKKIIFATGNADKMKEIREILEDLGDGTFAMMFELVDARNESATSDVILFTVEDGEIQAEA